MNYFLYASIIILFISCQNNTRPQQDDLKITQSENHQVQNSDVQNKYRVFDCYNGSQKEMNLCARQEYNYLDSILNQKHNELISMLNTRIDEDSENKNLISLKDRYLTAQKQWIILKNNNVSVIREKYQTGSILPMATDLQKSLDTRNRIDFIDMILDGFQ